MAPLSSICIADADERARGLRVSLRVRRAERPAQTRDLQRDHAGDEQLSFLSANRQLRPHQDDDPEESDGETDERARRWAARRVAARPRPAPTRTAPSRRSPRPGRSRHTVPPRRRHRCRSPPSESRRLQSSPTCADGGRRSPKNGRAAASSMPAAAQRSPASSATGTDSSATRIAEIRRAPYKADRDPGEVGELPLAVAHDASWSRSFGRPITIGMREVSFTVSSTIVVRVEVTPGVVAICWRSS